MFNIPFVALMAAPIAITAPAPAPTEACSTRASMPAIIDYVNKHLDKDITSPEVLASMQKFKDSPLYESGIENQNIEQIKGKIYSILASNLCDADRENIIITLLQNIAYENFFANIGLDTTKESADSTAVSKENIINPITGKVWNIRTGDGAVTQIKSIGQDGLSTIWKANRPGEEVYNLSTKTVLETFILALGKSQTFKNAKKSFDQSYAEIIGNTSKIDNPFTDALSKFGGALNAFFDASNLNANAKARLSNMEFVGDILDTKSYIGANDDETIIKLLNSNFGEVFFGSASKTLATTYNMPGDAGKSLRHAGITSILVLLKTYLDNWQNAKNDQLDKLSTMNSGTFLDDDSEVENILRIYADLFDKTAQLTMPVQIRVAGNIGGHNVLVRGGVTSDIPWTVLPQLKVYTLIYTGNLLQDNFEIRNLFRKTITPIGHGDTQMTRQFGFQPTQKVGTEDVSGRHALYADPKPVRKSDDNTNIFVSLWSSINGIQQEWSGGIDMHENDHDHDADVKNYHTIYETIGSCNDRWIPNDHSSYPAIIHDTSCTPDHRVIEHWVKNEFTATPVKQIIWEQNILDITNKIGDFKLLFRWHRDDATWEDTTFSRLKEQIIQQYKTLHDEVAQAISNPSGFTNFWHNTFDPTSTYTFKIELSSIEFGDVRFNTYDDDGWDDTHSDYFNFANAKANWIIHLIKEQK